MTKPRRSAATLAHEIGALGLVGLLVLTLVPALTAQTPIDDLTSIQMAVGEGPCSTHALLLFQACGADRRDDYLVHLADCMYVTSPGDQRSCRDAARWERSEKVDECEEVYEARLDVCDLVGESRFDVDFDPADFVDPDDIGASVVPNPFWPLTVGHTHVIVADGEVTVVSAIDDVRIVGGLPCRVVKDAVFEVEDDGMGGVEYSAVEITQDWYGQLLNGDIIYCGENTFEIEDDLIVDTSGSFANGTERARAGVLLRAAPVVGEGDRQELSSDNAEDYVEYVSLAASPSAAEGGDSAAFPCLGGCLQTFEVNPHDPGMSEFKYYLPGPGFVLATKLEDGEPTGEREEVTCAGDSLDVIRDPSCGIDDVDALIEELCRWDADLCLGG